MQPTSAAPVHRRARTAATEYHLSACAPPRTGGTSKARTSGDGTAGEGDTVRGADATCQDLLASRDSAGVVALGTTGLVSPLAPATAPVGLASARTGTVGSEATGPGGAEAAVLVLAAVRRATIR